MFLVLQLVKNQEKTWFLDVSSNFPNFQWSQRLVSTSAPCSLDTTTSKPFVSGNVAMETRCLGWRGNTRRLAKMLISPGQNVFFAVDLFMVYRFIHMFIHDVICVYIYNYNIYIYYIYEVYIYIYIKYIYIILHWLSFIGGFVNHQNWGGTWRSLDGPHVRSLTESVSSTKWTETLTIVTPW